MNAIKFILAASLALAPAFWAGAAKQATYSMAFSGDPASQWGNKVAETYDVAIHLNNPALVGKKIVSVSVPLTASGCDQAKFWLSSKLTLTKNVNVPDICSADAEYKGNDITLTFSEPYTIPAEGVYVGYSFSCNFSDEEPVAVVERAVPGSLWLHTSRRVLSWKDQSEKLGLCSAMKVTLEGDFAENGLNVLTLPDVTEGDSGTEALTVNATIENTGVSAISSIEYVVTSDGGEYTNTITLPSPVRLNYYDRMQLDLPLGEFSRVGDNPYTLTITKVNGAENMSDKRSGTGHVHITSYNPVCRPLLEEYTQFGCGYCVRGAAALERMYKLYPDEFVGVAYHNSDNITFTNIYPNAFQGYPTAFMNRTEKCDPYFGRLSGGFYIEDMWKEYQAKSVPMGIELKANWADESKTLVNVESSTTFARSADQQYSVTYLLVADGLQDWTWRQTNYYAGQSPSGWIEEMMPYLSGQKDMFGLVYNDIVVMSAPYTGVEGSLPRNPDINTENKHLYTFDTTKALSINDAKVNMVPDKNAVRVVAIVVDEKGQAVNCNITKVGTSGIESPVETAEVTSVEYYTLQGVRSLRPAPGVYIRVERLSDGSSRSSRVMVGNN